MPAKAASPAPSVQTTEITRSTSMPVADARAGLSDTARVALPMRDRCSHSTVMAMATAAMAARISDFGVTLTGPISSPL